MSLHFAIFVSISPISNTNVNIIIKLLKLVIIFKLKFQSSPCGKSAWKGMTENHQKFLDDKGKKAGYCWTDIQTQESI